MNAIDLSQPNSIVRIVHVPVNPLKAFEVFAGSIGKWWPRSHHVGAQPFKTVVIEPKVGGRIFEVSEDGTESEWGHVKQYEPGHLLVLAWQLDANWEFDANFSVDVRVTFTAAEDGTDVRLEHCNLEKYGAETDMVRQSIGSAGGWTGILAQYCDCIGDGKAGGNTHQNG